MPDPSVTPEAILQVCARLWAAAALKSGVNLQLFDALAKGPQDIAPVSQTRGAAPQSLRIVLDALVAPCQKKGTQTFFIENACH
jgi:hypothetical protein